MEEHFKTLKNLRHRRVAIINKKLEIYEACREKLAFHQFFLSNDNNTIL